MQKYIILTLLTFSFLLGEEADHIIFTQITITPDDAEMIAIYNPTNEAINLSDYYLSDAENTPSNKHYYNLPAGNDLFTTPMYSPGTATKTFQYTIQRLKKMVIVHPPNPRRSNCSERTWVKIPSIKP